MRARNDETAYASSAIKLFSGMPFPIYDMTSSIADRPESLGSKEKFWVIPDPALGLAAKPHLFKIGRAGTGENWSEKASFEIANLLGTPCAQYHLATCQGVQGTISERMFPSEGGLVLANLILSRLDPGYDDTLRFKQARHKLSVALNFVGSSVLKPPLGSEQRFPDLSARDHFIGYLVLDALIGNTDRHHENWGIVVVPHGDDNAYHLAATFDHASSLGRELTDAGRNERLTTNDKRHKSEHRGIRNSVPVGIL